MKTRKTPERTCVVTREKYPKQELLRIVKNNEGKVFVDLGGKSNGRGAYIKKDLAVLEKAIKTKVLDRQLECIIPPEIYEEIKNIIKP